MSRELNKVEEDLAVMTGRAGLPPEIRDEVRGPIQPDDMGVVGGEPSRLCGPEGENSSSTWSSVGSSSEMQDLEIELRQPFET